MSLLIPQLNELKVDLKFIGVPYLVDGKTLSGTDCAGLVCLFLKEHGIDISLNNCQQSIKELIRKGKVIRDKNELEPLDVLIFKHDNTYHAGVYIGYGKFLQQNVNTKSAIGRLSSLWGSYFYFAIRPTELFYNNEELYNEIKDKRIEFVATVIAAVATAVAGAVTGAALTAGAVALSSFAYSAIYAITYAAVSFALYAGLSYGVSALMASSQKAPKPNFGVGGVGEGSPRYGFGSLQNTATSDLPVPVLYGQLKLAGNAVYQSDPGETVYRCDVLCEGEVSSITDIRINDIPIAELSGCSVTTYTGTTSQNVDSRFSNRVYGLRNLANLSTTLQTSDKLKGGFPAITCIVQGLKIETWDGLKWTSTKSYSNNPAACIRDFIINTRYGIGLSRSLLDESSFGEVYDYCDVLVSDNEGGTEKRYTLDYVIDSKKPAVDILNELLSVCGGFLVWSGNRLKLRTEKVENVVQNFTMSNIVEGSFSYQYVPKDTMVNKVRLLYVDPNQNYTKVYALAEDKVSQDERANIEGGSGVVEKEVALLGVTDFSRASRLANLFLKVSKATPMTCKFKVGIYSLHCEPGDVITVSHDVSAWTNKPFRIFSIEEEENDEATIICKEYNDSVYDDSYGSGIVAYQYGTPPNYLKNTSEVSGIILTEVGWRNEDGTHIANIDVTWTAPAVTDYLTGYYLEWSKDSGTYQFADRADTGSNYKRLPNATVGSTYTVRVKTVNYYGIFSSGTISGSISITGKDDPPPNVEGFVVNQDRDALIFNWNKITSVPDINHYEIKYGASWSSGSVVGNWVKGTSYRYNGIVNGTSTYWIKAVDNSGNYSTSATTTQVTVENIPFSNIILTQNEHTGWAGDKVNVSTSLSYAYDDSTQEYADTDVSYASQGYGGLQIDAGYLSGDYLTSWIDAGKQVTAKVALSVGASTSGDLAWDSDATLTFSTYDNLRWTGFDTAPQVDFFIQTSGDSGASGDFVPWQYADYLFKAVRIKARLRREDVNSVVTVTSMTSTVDVPDVTDYGPTDGTYKFCPSGGDSVSFSKTFFQAPTVAIMVYPSGGVIRIPEVTATTTGFSLTLRDKTDAAVQGNYRWVASGY